MSNKTLTIPSIPANWIVHTGVLPAGNGYRTRVQKVLHTVGGYHPFCIHTAYEYNGEWAYECGRYFKDEAAALAAFEKA
jgi:hypothetical protein